MGFSVTGRHRSYVPHLSDTLKKMEIQLGVRSHLIFSLNLVSHVKIVGLMKICLTERCSGVWGGQHLTDMFLVENGSK